PVVGANSTGLRDVIINNQTGFLVKPHSAESFAEAITKVIEAKDEFRINAVNHAKQNFDLRKVTQDLLNLYKRVQE
ncbi:MAG: glycosyltransferase, partial [Candidatus Micrarchaeota archaeon]|nr:glycosyltransferase [Candidatus Micrarchaeota archaeon]